MNLGATIRKYRKVRKMTQAQMADRVNMSIAHLSLLENNKRHPSILVAESVAKALGMPLSVLIFLAEERGNVPELSIRDINNLSTGIKDLMEKHIEGKA